MSFPLQKLKARTLERLHFATNGDAAIEKRTSSAGDPVRLEAAISEKELIRALERIFTSHSIRPQKVVRLERRLSDYCSTFAIEELDVEMEGGERYALVLKDLSWNALIQEARGVKPDFLYNPLREIEMYQGVLKPQHWGTPRYYGSEADTRQQRYWLFLERIDGDKMRFVGEFEIWREVARWIARFHADNRAHAEELLSRTNHLIVYSEDYFYGWMERARLYLRRIQSERTQESFRQMDALASRYGEVVYRLTGQPVTLLHGDFFPSNILVKRGTVANRICPVDWEMAALGPGLVDLAGLVAGSWTEEERTDLAMAYYETLARSGMATDPPDVFLTTLNFCRLHLAVQWLGWSTDWTPPSEERQDWLHEALQIAEELHLIGPASS